MLAQLGRRPRNRTGGLAELRGRARLPHLTKAVVESPFDRLARDNLLVLKEFRAPQGGAFGTSFSFSRRRISSVGHLAISANVSAFRASAF